MTAPTIPSTTRRTPTHRRATTLWTLGAPAVLATAGVAVALSWRPDLPDPVATHFGSSGTPDAFGPLTPHVVAPAIIVMIFAVFMWAIGFFAGHAAFVRRMAAAGAVWFAGVLMGTIVGSLAMQRGLADAADAPSTSGAIGAAFGMATVLAAVAVWATPRDAHQPTTEPIPADADLLDLGPDEHAAWVARTSNVRLAGLAGGVFTLVAAVAAVSRIWWVVAIGAAVALLLVAIVRWTVVVDRDGLTARSLLRRPVVRVPLDEVVRAEVADVNPLRDFGGWGMRVGLRGQVGVVVRAGEALVVERTGDRSLVVTVDDAATAAKLLNTLAARSRTA